MTIRVDENTSGKIEDLIQQLLSDGPLRVSVQIKAGLDRMGVHSREDLAGLLQTFPSSIAPLFNLSPDDINRVRTILFQKEGKSMTDPPIRFAMGARDPQDLVK